MQIKQIFKLTLLTAKWTSWYLYELKVNLKLISLL